MTDELEMQIDYSGLNGSPALASRVMRKLRRLLRRPSAQPHPLLERALVRIEEKKKGLAQHKAKHQHPRTQEGIDKCRF